VIGIKLKQLQQNIEREEILNYQLSSKALEEKFQLLYLGSDNFVREIRNGILESNVLNSKVSFAKFELSELEIIGLGIINIVRLISFKPMIHLHSDAKNILLLQFAFYLERGKYYEEAAKRYEELGNSFTNFTNDEFRFVLLHQAFCLSMFGKNELALKKLNKLQIVARGTHFEKSASTIIAVIKSNQKSGVIASSEELYSRNEFYRVVQLLEKRDSLSVEEKFLLAKSLEQIGRLNQAIVLYKQLIAFRKNLLIAKKANRRLILIGYFYRPNKSLVSYSKRSARSLGDYESIAIAEAGTMQVKNSVLLKYNKQGFWNKLGLLYPEKLFLIIKDFFSVRKEQKKFVKKNRERSNFSSGKHKFVLPAIVVQLQDGETFKLKSIQFERNGKVKFKLGNFFIFFPSEKIVSIQLSKYYYPDRSYYLEFVTSKGKLLGTSYKGSELGGEVRTFSNKKKVPPSIFKRINLKYSIKEEE
ncbi:MAG: hypothetical protein AAF518_21310, partial [Spirochaetota bacterium]